MFDDQNDLMSLTINSESIERDNIQISKTIDSVFEDMQVFVKQYDYFVQIFNENVSMQVDDFRHKEHEAVNSTINKLIN